MSNYLICACSGAKVPQSTSKAGRDHPLRSVTDLQVFALSAEYGLIKEPNP